MRITESQLRRIVRSLVREAAEGNIGQQVFDEISKRMDFKKLDIRNVAEIVEEILNDKTGKSYTLAAKLEDRMKKSAAGKPKADPERLKADKIPADSAFALLDTDGLRVAIEGTVNNIVSGRV